MQHFSIETPDVVQLGRPFRSMEGPGLSDRVTEAGSRKEGNSTHLHCIQLFSCDPPPMAIFDPIREHDR
jgi:hypothetical protein